MADLLKRATCNPRPPVRREPRMSVSIITSRRYSCCCADRPTAEETAPSLFHICLWQPGPRKVDAPFSRDVLLNQLSEACTYATSDLRRRDSCVSRVVPKRYNSKLSLKAVRSSRPWNTLLFAFTPRFGRVAAYRLKAGRYGLLVFALVE